MKITEDQWNNVDWSQNNMAIARQLEVTPTTVFLQRRKRSMPPSPNGRPRLDPVDILALAHKAETPPATKARPEPVLRQVVTVLRDKGWTVPEIALWIKNNNPRESRGEIKLRRYVSGVLYKLGRKG